MRLEATHLYREIHEQPEALERFLRLERAGAQRLADDIRERGIRQVVIAARGTSDNAARYAKYVLGAKNGLVVALAAPSLFSIYRQPPQLGHALVMGISQSGRSPDIVAVLAEARRQGALTAVLTNAGESPLAREADHVIDLHAGEEKAVAATKTYTGELAGVALLSATLAHDIGMMEELAHIPEAVARTLNTNKLITQVVHRYRHMRYCTVIGRGYNYATAFEMALKLKELTYIVVEPYSSADFMHGPLALLEPGFPVFVIAPSGRMLPEIRTFVGRLRERKAEIVAISDDPETIELSGVRLALPSPVPEWLSPVTAIVPGQLFAMHLAHTRGYDVDSPRAIQKVTETR